MEKDPDDFEEEVLDLSRSPEIEELRNKVHETYPNSSEKYLKLADIWLTNGMRGQAAAVAAGYAEASARITASKILALPQIRAYTEHMARIAIMPPYETMARISAEASATIEDFIDIQDGKGSNDKYRLNLQKARDNGVLGAVGELTYNEFGYPVVKLNSQASARQLVAKYHKLLIDKVEHSGAVKVERPALENATDDELDALESILLKTGTDAATGTQSS